MKRPIRDSLSIENLVRRGIPKKFHTVTMSDYKDYGDSELREVRTKVREYLSDLDYRYSSNEGLLLWGNNGVGKTMLSCIIIKEAYRHRYSSKRVTFVEYVTEYTRIWSANKEDKEDLEERFYHDFKAVEFLVLEEIGKEIDSKITTPILEDCLRYREDKGLVTIICSNLSPKLLLSKYDTSIFSLIQGNCTPIKIESVDKRNSCYNERVK